MSKKNNKKNKNRPLVSTKSNKEAKNRVFFKVRTAENRVIQIERTSNWEINITQAAKSLNKRWRNWKKWNAETIKTFEKSEGRKLVRETNDKRYPQTFLDFFLALRVLNDYDSVLSHRIFKLYKQEIISNSLSIRGGFESSIKKLQLLKAKIAKKIQLLKVKNAKKIQLLKAKNAKKIQLLKAKNAKKIQLLKAENAKLKKKPIDVSLTKGENLLYAYECNGKTKFGTSFTNKNGQRPKSHKISVPNLRLGFVLYASKENLQYLSKVIKIRFNTKTEHVNCSVGKLKKFVFSFCDLMKWKYIKEDLHILKLLNILLAF